MKCGQTLRQRVQNLKIDGDPVWQVLLIFAGVTAFLVVAALVFGATFSGFLPKGF